MAEPVAIGGLLVDPDTGRVVGTEKEREEKKFRDWYVPLARMTGIDEDPDNPLHQYDYRAAYKAGVSPTLDPTTREYHWPSQFKADTHPNRFIRTDQGVLDTKYNKLVGEKQPHDWESSLKPGEERPENFIQMPEVTVTATQPPVPAIQQSPEEQAAARKVYEERVRSGQIQQAGIVAPPQGPEPQEKMLVAPEVTVTATREPVPAIKQTPEEQAAVEKVSRERGMAQVQPSVERGPSYPQFTGEEFLTSVAVPPGFLAKAGVEGAKSGVEMMKAAQAPMAKAVGGAAGALALMVQAAARGEVLDRDNLLKTTATTIDALRHYGEAAAPMAAGALRTGFGVATPVVGPLAGFTYGNVALEAVWPQAMKLMTPVTSMTEPKTLTGQALAEIADLTLQMLLFAGVHRGIAQGIIGKIRENRPLSADERAAVEAARPRIDQWYRDEQQRALAMGEPVQAGTVTMGEAPATAAPAGTTAPSRAGAAPIRLDVGITTATESPEVPVISQLLELGRKAEAEGRPELAQSYYGQVLSYGQQRLQASVADVPGVRMKVERSVGNYFQTTEPTFVTSITIEDPAQIPSVMARLSAVADAWRQQTLHVSRDVGRLPQGEVFGAVRADGSVFEPTVEIRFPRQLTAEEFAEVARLINETRIGEDTLAGATLHPDGQGITFYNVSRFLDAQKFADLAQAAASELYGRGLAASVQPSVRQLWVAGDPAGGATLGYADIQGRVLPEEAFARFQREIASDPYAPPEQAHLRYRDKMVQRFNIPLERVDAHAAVLDVFSRVWALQTGKPREEWWTRRIADLERIDQARAQQLANLRQNGEPAPVWYSHMEKILKEKVANNATAEQILATLKNNGVKDDEIYFSGLGELLASKKGPISKNMLLNELFSGDDVVRMVEDWTTGDSWLDYTTFGQAWTRDPHTFLFRLEGGPFVESVYREPHFGREPNVVAHARTSVVSSVKGLLGLLVDEIQSTWHETGREKGYIRRRKPIQSAAELKLREAWESVKDINDTVSRLSLTRGRNYPAEPIGSITNRFYSDVPQQSRVARRPEFRALVDSSERAYRDAFEERLRKWGDAYKQWAMERLDPADLPEWNQNFLILWNALNSAWNKRLELLRASFEGWARSFIHEQDAIAQTRLANAQRMIAEFETGQVGNVPEAPFRKTWHEMVMRRMLRYAAEQGHDAIYWTTGKTQKERYNLSKLVSGVAYVPELKELWVWRKVPREHIRRGRGGEWEPMAKGVTPEKLREYIGKDPAEKLLAEPLTDRLTLDNPVKGGPDLKSQSLIGQNLDLGGQGMNYFYDRMIPDYMRKLGKKWGVEPELDWIVPRHLGTSSAVKAWSMRITPEMRESILSTSMPLYQDIKGAVRFLDDHRAIIYGVKNPDISTAFHEFGHVFRRDLYRRIFEVKPEYREQVAKDIATLEEHYRGGEQGYRWDTKAEEQFARDLERYFYDGKAPTPELQGIFERIAEWMMEVYRELRGSDIEREINPKVREIFDRYMGKEDRALIDARADKVELLKILDEVDAIPILAQRGPGISRLKEWYIPGTMELLRMVTKDGRLDRTEWERRMKARFKEIPEIDLVWREANKQYVRTMKVLRDNFHDFPDDTRLSDLFKQGEDGKDFYERQFDKIKEIFGGDADLVVRFIAATSPLKTVSENVATAMGVYRAYKRGERMFTRGLLPVVSNMLRQIVNNEPEFGGLKVSSFYKNLTEDFTKDMAVTVDRWIARLMFGKESVNENEYLLAEDLIRQKAKELGIPPRHYQAALWRGIKLETEGLQPVEYYSDLLLDRIGNGYLDDLLKDPRIELPPELRAARTGPAKEMAAYTDAWKAAYREDLFRSRDMLRERARRSVLEEEDPLFQTAGERAMSEFRKERPVMAAWRDPRTGKIYLGENHAKALEAAGIVDFDKITDMGMMQIAQGEGFITDRGRFVTRAEAASMIVGPRENVVRNYELTSEELAGRRERFGDTSVAKILPKHHEEAIKYFGETVDPREGGWLLPDGAMLDFSGKNRGGQGGVRVLDHREILQIAGNSIEDWLAAGAIRLKPEMGGFEIGAPPTWWQQRALKDWMDWMSPKHDQWVIDMYDPSTMRYHTAVYMRGVRPDRLYRDVDNFLYAAAKPKGDVLLQAGPPLSPVNLGDLTRDIDQIPKTVPFRDRIKLKRLLDKDTPRDALEYAWRGIKYVAQGTYAKAWGKPVFTTFQKIFGEMDAQNQLAANETMRFAKESKKRFSSRELEAIVNWVQVGGDIQELQRRATDPELNAKNPKRVQGYVDAQNLSPQARLYAERLSQYFDARLQQGIQAGILTDGLEHYITQIWERPNPATDRLVTDLAAGNVPTRFKSALRRVFDSYFEGERLGYKPAIKNAAELVAVYDQAFNRILAARAFIKSLHDGVAKDGRPWAELEGGRMEVGADEPTGGAVLIHPHMFSPVRKHRAGPLKGQEYRTSDYVPVDHPAMRGWKWAETTDEGKSVMYKADMRVHPEIASHVKAILEPSVLRKDMPAFRKFLELQGQVKQTKLSLSLFHQFHVGEHALFHQVSPFKPKPVNLRDPVQYFLASHGLKVADFHALNEFAEGLAGGGLFAKIPGAGPYIQGYTDWLFKTYIPALKVTMGEHALRRNIVRYGTKDMYRQMFPNDPLPAEQLWRPGRLRRYKGELDLDQIGSLTALQSNAAFGELNYKMMGRSQMTQDLSRLFFLAPDFLEARLRFAGQAASHYGAEQRVALSLMAMTMWTTSRILNGIFNDGDLMLDRPFTVKIGDKEWGIRSVIGDVAHLVTDPRSFAYNRLAPFLRMAIESPWVTGRDDRGVKQTSWSWFKQVLSWAKPITLTIRPGEGGAGETIATQMAAGIGITSRIYRSAAYKRIRELMEKKGETIPTEEQIAKYEWRRAAVKKLQGGKPLTPDELREGVEYGFFKERPDGGLEATPALEKALSQTPLQRMFGSLSAEEAAEVYALMEPDERAEVTEIYNKKLNPKKK